MAIIKTDDQDLDLIDRKQHPIDRIDEPDGRAMIDAARASIAETGCLVVRGLLTDAAVERISSESRDLAPKAHFNHGRATVYGENSRSDLPDNDPRSRVLERYNGFVAGDYITEGTALRRLYHEHSFQDFIAACVGADELHEYADPLASLVINVVPPGSEHAWHFDGTEFVVTMLTQKPDAGGLFEYCPGIRSTDDENREAVSSVLDGDRHLVRSLELNPGDLQIFFGRNSMHRVSPVVGTRDRHTVIFGYSKQANSVASVEKSRNLFGRTGEAHAG